MRTGVTTGNLILEILKFGCCQEKKHDVISQDTLDQTFYHEVVHAILDTIGEHELSANEKFVQQFSVLLHQFETTKK